MEKFLLNSSNRQRFWLLLIGVSSFQLIKLFLFHDFNNIELIGDAKWYVGMLENLAVNGEYSYLENTSARMPGLLPIYLPIRLLFSYNATLKLVIVLLTLLYSYSVVKAAYTFLEVGLLKWSGVIVFTVLLGFTDYATIYNYNFYMDGAGVSVFLLFSASFANYLKHRSRKALLVASVLMAWLIFLRPYTIVLIPVCVLIIILNDNGRKKEIIKKLLVFSSCILLSLLVWSSRNFINEKKFIPLQNSIMAGGDAYTKSYLKIRELASLAGQNNIEWEPTSLACWFQPDEMFSTIAITRPDDDVIPGYFLDDEFSMDSLKYYRSQYWKLTKRIKEEGTKDQKLDDEISAYLNRGITKLKENHFLRVFVLNRLKIVKSFIIQPYTYYLHLPENGSISHKLMKGFIYLINAILFFIGFTLLILFSVVYSVKYKAVIENRLLFLPIILMIFSWFLIFLFPFYLGSAEYRFTAMMLPSFGILISLSADFLVNKVQKRNI